MKGSVRCFRRDSDSINHDSTWIFLYSMLSRLYSTFLKGDIQMKGTNGHGNGHADKRGNGHAQELPPDLKNRHVVEAGIVFLRTQTSDPDLKLDRRSYDVFFGHKPRGANGAR